MVHIGMDDPLASLVAPPPNETPEAKQARERNEAEARRINDAIDEQIRQERNSLKKKKKPVKVLLIGQSESGASHIPCCASVPHSAYSFLSGKSATLKSRSVRSPLSITCVTQHPLQTSSSSMHASSGSSNACHGEPSFTLTSYATLSRFSTS